MEVTKRIVLVDAKTRRKYKLHYNLRRKGNMVVTSQKWVTKRAKEVSDIENKWLSELVNFGYCVGDGLFTPPMLRINN